MPTIKKTQRFLLMICIMYINWRKQSFGQHQMDITRCKKRSNLRIAISKN